MQVARFERWSLNLDSLRRCSVQVARFERWSLSVAEMSRSAVSVREQNDRSQVFSRAIA
ncbi:hypothetical protein [Nostoc sp. C117]|uniref:hypothetical protein n=1 Tax=Nostoc sp. C117 TaxID=3349875 RepID=UPI00370DC07E